MQGSVMKARLIVGLYRLKNTNLPIYANKRVGSQWEYIAKKVFPLIRILSRNAFNLGIFSKIAKKRNFDVVVVHSLEDGAVIFGVTLEILSGWLKVVSLSFLLPRTSITLLLRKIIHCDDRSVRSILLG